jgi:predicted nucleic acid-binding protein
MIVVDASVLATALGDDGAEGRRARRRLSGEQLAAPEVIDLEVISVWRRLGRAGRLPPDRAAQAVADLEALPLERVSHKHLIRQCWDMRDNVRAYDAAYIAVAEIIEATLLTADERLANAPVGRCRVELLQ